MSLIALVLISIPVQVRAGEEIPLLPDAAYFRTASATAIPTKSEAVQQRTLKTWKHPLLEKSSLFGRETGWGSSNEESPGDSLFERRPLPPPLGRSYSHPTTNAELFPTLPTVRTLPLPSLKSASHPTAARTLPLRPSEQPVILQSDFTEFPPLD